VREAELSKVVNIYRSLRYLYLILPAFGLSAVFLELKAGVQPVSFLIFAVLLIASIIQIVVPIVRMDETSLGTRGMTDPYLRTRSWDQVQKIDVVTDAVGKKATLIVNESSFGTRKYKIYKANVAEIRNLIVGFLPENKIGEGFRDDRGMEVR
jgi:hypothetical protein